MDELPASAAEHHHRPLHALRQVLAGHGRLGVLGLALEQRDEAAAVHRVRELAREPGAREVGERRQHVDERDGLPYAPGREARGAAHDERDAGGMLAERHLVEEPVLAEELAVVGGEEHDRVVDEPAALESRQHLPDLLVHVREARVVPVP